MITKQRAEDADKDAITLSKHVNGTVDDPPNINRVGNDVENLAKIRATTLELAADVANRQVYLTEAEMLADTAQPIKTPARVETGSGAGDYVMTASGWVWSDVQTASTASLAAESSARATGDDALNVRVDNEKSARHAGDDALGVRVDNETLAREQAVQQVQTAADGALTAANNADEKAEAAQSTADAAQNAAAAAQQAAASASVAAGDAQQTAASAVQIAQKSPRNDALIGAHIRPGDFATAYGNTTVGTIDNTQPLPESMVVTDAAIGFAIQVSDERYVAPRSAMPLELERTYELRFSVKRQQNPNDPLNDAVQLGVQFLTSSQSAAAAGNVTLETLPLVVADGEMRYSFVLSRSAGEGVDVVAPFTARYVRPWVRTFGVTHQTRIGRVSIHDVTPGATLSGEIGQITETLTQLQEGIQSERTERIAADEAESLARQQGDDGLGQRIDSEAANRQDAIEGLQQQFQSDLEAEALARQQAQLGPYATMVEGLSHAVDGQYFTVTSTKQNGFLDLYQVTDGEATYIGTHPSLDSVEFVMSLIGRGGAAPSFVLKDELGFSVGHITPGETDLPGIAARDGVTDSSTYTHTGESGFALARADGSRVSMGALSAEYARTGTTSMSDDDGFAGLSMSSNQSLIGAGGFAYSTADVGAVIDPMGFAGNFYVKPPESRSGLADHYDAITNPLRDYMLVLCGDSKTWGLRLTGNSPQGDQNHRLTDPRDNLASPSWANLLRLRLGQSFMSALSTDVPTEDQPGSGYWTKDVAVDVVRDQRFRVVDIGGQPIPRAEVAAEGASFGYTLQVPAGAAVEFDAHCPGLTIVYVANSGRPEAEFSVQSNGVEYARQSFYSVDAVYGQTVVVTWPMAARTARIVNLSRSTLSLEAVTRTKTIRVANQGVIGTNSSEWLPGGNLLPAAVRGTDTSAFVALGTNNRQQLYPERFKRDLVQIIRHLRGAHNLGVVLVADSATDETIDYPYPGRSEKFGLQDIRRMVLEVAREEDADVIDLYDITRQLILDGETLHSLDKIHENELGHKTKFERIWTNLMSQKEHINVY